MGDLNRVSKQCLVEAKACMEVEFQANVIAPEDEDFEYDKQVDFGGGKMETSGWDSNTESEF